MVEQFMVRFHQVTLAKELDSVNDFRPASQRSAPSDRNCPCQSSPTGAIHSTLRDEASFVNPDGSEGAVQTFDAAEDQLELRVGDEDLESDDDEVEGERLAEIDLEAAEKKIFAKNMRPKRLVYLMDAAYTNWPGAKSTETRYLSLLEVSPKQSSAEIATTGWREKNGTNSRAATDSKHVYKFVKFRD
ncbi:hypothetical protein LTR10_021932 [Elasticomyces elasticus]|uniref:Uncharacterized protein n=1 Tax=Exophiala sideris TaxID=1016849 RepID=A0ABR0IWK1_9EURO|nr:hypothetical protein LTR10_021932 [Elasticomyces elasticus]KAK5021836.1 hypothetical protein LTS07_010577 [Exophiala sideris]KAK5025901.1 hypothetical protein LTR13_010214 [Exophiala sideris]KAK5050266.1 hypothetical protein LTR69_010601 [Exophiala sideris]KAK5177129.1 hypothetical protein LTR44_010413 [Eurotiomycetes sp. CCFEE 6388]